MSDSQYTDATDRPWHILGTGAIGGLWACHLQAAGQQVRLLPSPQSLNSYIAQPELSLSTPTATSTRFEHFRFGIESATSATAIEQLLVTTKSHQTEAAITRLHDRIAASATLVVLQNGMGAQQWLAAQFPSAAVYAGTTTEGANRPAPREIVHAGRGESYYGPLNERARKEQQNNEALQVLLQLPLRGHYDADIELRLWQKLAINAVINPITAVHNCRNGELLENPAYRQQMRQLSQEFESLSRALERPLFTEPLFTVASRVAHQTAANISSMLQDIRQGQPSEINYINGYVCRLAASLNMTDALSTHAQLLQQVQALDARSGQAPGAACNGNTETE